MNNYISRAKEILKAEAQAISNIPINDSFSKAVESLYNCKGKIITTGMGKAGNIATKIAGTLCSTGTPAVFLHPGDSFHGDLGLLTDKDVILAFSTSGKTKEILHMLDRAQKFGIHSIIAITSHSDAQIREIADIVIDMGIIEEPCKLGLTPTSSTTAMIALGDALSLVLMEKKNITKTDYGMRHHGGYLGEKARDNS